MPSIVSESVPFISEPVQLASATLRGINVGASSSRTTLQAKPSSSTACHGGVASMGTVVRLSTSGGLLKRSKAHAVFVSQGEGIVVLNPVTQRALSSYTFPPSHQPTTPPLVIIDGSHQTTFMCIWARTEGDAVELHSWTEAITKTSDRDGQPLDTQPDHYVAEADGSITSLHPLSQSQLLAQHCDGSLSVIDFGSLKQPRARRADKKTEGQRNIVEVTVLDRMAASSILAKYPSRPSGALVITLSCAPSTVAQHGKSKTGRKGRRSAIDVIDAAEENTQPSGRLDSIEMDLTVVESDGNIRQIGKSTSLSDLLAAPPSGKVVSASLHHSGRLAILLSSNELLTMMLKVDAEGEPTFTDTSRLSLTVPTQAQMNSTDHCAEVVALTPSTLFLTLQSPTSTSQAVALLIDVDLCAVLSESTWRTSAQHIGGVFSHRIGGSNILLLVAPQGGHEKPRNDGITLYVASYEASDGNHLRWALASQHLTQKWLAMSDKEHGNQHKDGKGDSQQGILDEFSRLRESQDSEAGKKMDAIFEQYIATVESSRPLGVNRTPQRDDVEYTPSMRTHLSQSFAQKIAALAIPSPRSLIIQGETKANRAYASKTVQTLLELHALQAGQVAESRLLEALWDVQDHDAVLKALQQVEDLKESDIAVILSRSLDQDRAEKFESGTSFENLFAIVADLPITRSSFRYALKTQMNDKNITKMLEVLTMWLERTSREAVLQQESARKPVSEPSIQGVLSLAIDILDTFFPALLRDKAHHVHITALSEQVQAHLTSINGLQMLRAPLAAFSRLEEEMKREAEAVAAAKEQRMLDDDASDDDDRRLTSMRKAAKSGKDSASGNAIGQIGGGSMSKYGLAEKSRRLKLKEESLSVGLYQLESFEL